MPVVAMGLYAFYVEETGKLMRDKRFKYAYKVDMYSDTTAAKILKLVGRGKRVLELGCGPGHMSQVLREDLGCLVTGIEIDPDAAKEAGRYCEDVIVCNLDEIDLTNLFERQPFDVVIMADVLEHLKAPERTLLQCKGLIQDNGFVVISIPNVAHAGIVASLMQAQFPYSDIGLLDSTHLRFFTGPSFRSLLRRVGYCIDHWQAHEVPVEFTEFAPTFNGLPKPVREFLFKCPDSNVYQFILKVRPVLSDEQDFLSQRLDMDIEKSIKERDIWMKNNYSCKCPSNLGQKQKGKFSDLVKKFLGIKNLR